MKKILALLFLNFFLVSSSFSQFYELGLNPSKLKWYQIKTDKAQVIFPMGLESQAQRVARLVNFMADSTKSTVGSIDKRVSIILQNQTTIPNGFVAVSPFRSEFFTTPPQFNFAGSSNWLDLLTIHEYRHVLQNQNARVGITKLMGIAFGQNGWGFMSGMAVPRWYSEGDAVVAETSYSNSGRGRTPDFDKEYRALRLENRFYNYEKAGAGSYKDFVPTHYQLGYNMVSYARNTYGKDIWAKVLNGAGKYKGIFYPFSHTLKKETGLSTKQLYNKTMEHLDSLYQADLADLELSESEQLTSDSKAKYTDYRNPQFMNDGRLVVEKSSLDEIRTYYLIDKDGNETKLFASGFNVDMNATVSVKNGRITWSEYAYHPRWFNKNYSVIRTASAIPNAVKAKISAKSKYFAPDLSADAQKMVVSEVSDQVKYALVILDAFNGEVIKSLPNPDNYFFTFPRWMEGEQHIVAVASKDNQNAVAKINVEDGSIEFLTDMTTEQISNTHPNGDYVFFAGSFTGINNIYAVKQGDKTIYQVTSTQLGAFQPAVSPDGKTLAYSEYSAMGYDIMTTSIQPNTWKAISIKTDNVLTLYKTALKQDGGAIFDKVEKEDLKIKRFRKVSGMLQLHSWNPIISDPYDPEGGIEIDFDNKISTFSATGGYLYNATDQSGRFYGELAYGEFWPIFRLGYTGKNKREAGYLDFYGSYEDGIDTTYFGGYYKRWTEEAINIGITLPFNLTKGNFISDAQFNVDYEHININYADSIVNTRDGLKDEPNAKHEGFIDLANATTDEALGLLDFDFYIRGNRLRAKQNIYPKFGYFLGLRHRNIISDTDGQGNSTLLRGRMFLPGFFKNDGFLIVGQYQVGKRTDTYTFRNAFASSRGYPTYSHDKASRFSINYAFPIAYPDVAIGSLAFIQRIKGNVFFDIARYTRDLVSLRIPEGTFNNGGFSFNLRSIGLELTTDFRAFRLLDVDLGVRYSFKLDNNVEAEVINSNTPTASHSFEFLLVRITP